ncbi:hypothetical protein M2T55_26785, partial [Klebsiella pneumoniae]|nr:hypothetical protein [Klebsiella pneumoniae]
GKNSLNRLIRCVCGKKIGPDPRNFNQRVSLGRNDLLIRTFPNTFKQQYPNTENKSPQSMGRSAKIQQSAADSAAVAGSTSPYSGGTVGGSLGSTYDDE